MFAQPAKATWMCLPGTYKHVPCARSAPPAGGRRPSCAREARPQLTAGLRAKRALWMDGPWPTMAARASKRQGIKQNGIGIPKIFRKKGALRARRFAPTPSRTFIYI
jgi:hypothetical protein